MVMQFNLTITQAAAVLGRSPKTVRGLIESGRLKAVDVSNGERRKHYTISPDAIKEFEQKSSDDRIQRINAVAHEIARRGTRWGRSRFDRKASA